MGYQIHQPAVPNADDKWSAAEHNGALLLFFPTEIRRGIKTSNGDADAVACSRVVNLNSGRILHNTLIFGTALVPNVAPGAPDGVVVGRLTQGVAKNGNNPPWILQPHDEADLALAQAWLAQDAQNAVTQPTAPPTQAAQGGWGAQAPAASPAPATGGWGAPAPQAAAPQAGWGAPAPVQAPVQAPPVQAAQGGWGAAASVATPAIDPGLVAALQSRGVDPATLTSQVQAEQIAAALGLTKG